MTMFRLVSMGISDSKSYDLLSMNRFDTIQLNIALIHFSDILKTIFFVNNKRDLYENGKQPCMKTLTFK